MTVYVNGVNTSLVAESLSDVDASADELNITDGLRVPLTLSMPFTLGDRSGVFSNGVYWGQAETANGIPYLFHYDSSTTTFVSESTDAQSATAADVTFPDPFDTNDAIYFGHSGKFSMLRITISTQGAGDAVAAEMAWEYYNGSTWADLETGCCLIDSSTALSAATGNRFVSFEPPSNWAATSVNSQSAFWVRVRATADDVWNTTQPVVTQVIAYPLLGFAVPGFSTLAPATGSISGAVCFATTNSGSTADTKFLLINSTTGSATTITWTKQRPIDATTLSGPLSVTAGDELIAHVIQEDGTTEFANGSITLYITA